MRSLFTLSLALGFFACTPTVPVATPFTCNADETACSGSCAKLKVDDLNCGSCARACGTGDACANSACYPTDCEGVACDPSSVCFENVCTEKACVGVICPTGLTCSQGACVCGSGRLSCSGACVDPLTDETSCGGCGAACGGAESCVEGACLPNDCPQEDCDQFSVCYQNKCTEQACVGVVCAGSQVCRGGSCACAANETVCNGQCVDPKLNSTNCGTCGTSCAADSRCAAGACLPKDCPGAPCDPLSVCYQGACVEAACVGVACAGGQQCSAGVCSCPAGERLCGGTCVDVDDTFEHCGRCGNSCPTGQACAGGACITNACSGGQTPCGGGCVDTRIDPANCGACGAACGLGRNCVASQCACPPGLTLCGTTCVNIATDGTNCGACGRSCGAGSCSGGFCQCPSGQTLCNGTCVTMSTDPNNCGMCGRTCSASQVCTAGSCACPPGQTLCSGQCIPTAADNLNCGGCGTVCPSGRYCSAGMCVVPFTCQTNFNTPPADCADFPVTLSACGQPMLANTSGPFTGSLTNGNRFVLPVPTAPNELTRITTTMMGTGSGANFRIGYLTDAGVELTANTGTAGSITPNIQVMEHRGNLSSCANPAGYQVYDSFGNLSYSTQLERFSTNGRTNVGGLSNASPTALRTNTAGRTCDQVCGQFTGVCGDTGQTFSVVIPGGKAAIFQLAAYSDTAGSIYNLHAFETNGNTICGLVFNQLVDDFQWSFFSARLVNNTAQTQTVVLRPNLSFGGSPSDFFHLSVAVEP